MLSWFIFFLYFSQRWLFFFKLFFWVKLRIRFRSSLQILPRLNAKPKIFKFVFRFFLQRVSNKNLFVFIFINLLRNFELIFMRDNVVNGDGFFDRKEKMIVILKIEVCLLVFFHHHVAHSNIVLQFFFTVYPVLKKRLQIRKQLFLILTLTTLFAYQRKEILLKRYQWIAHPFLIVGFLKILDCCFIFLKFEMDNPNEKENIWPLEYFSAIFDEKLFKSITWILHFCKLLKLFLMHFVYLFS